MNHVAIDLGSRESQVCIRRPDGTIVEERKHPTRKLADWMRTWETSRVILETSSEAFRIADAAKAAGHEVRVVPATLAKQLGVGARGVKTDARDAQTLSQVSCRIDVPSVHIPTTEARELRSIIRSRETLTRTRTMSINHVRGWLRTQLWRVRTGSAETFADRVRAHAIEQRQPVPPHIERILLVIEAMTLQLRDADRQIRTLARQSAVCRRLMTVPGIGVVTAVAFVAQIDDVSRFAHAYQLQSYLGLTPGENSSSERERRTGITKAGSSTLRQNLIQAAWTALRYPKEPMVRWATRVAERRGKFIGVVALARKLAGIMYALWRDDTIYIPTKTVQPDAAN